jgi:hypothetical protein
VPHGGIRGTYRVVGIGEKLGAKHSQSNGKTEIKGGV